MRLRFWGTRGSIPAPGPDTLRFGGNSTCLQLELGGQQVIIDAGSGIRPLGQSLLGKCKQVTLLITHLHPDHLMGFPFFAPIFDPEMTILVGGWPNALHGLKRLFYSGRPVGGFPVPFDHLPARIVRGPGLDPPRFSLGGYQVRTTPLSHPQGSIGYRFDGPEGALVFITDNELPPQSPSPRLVDFCRGAKVLIHDCQYLPSEMGSYHGRGHSAWPSALALSQAAGVGRLLLTHHDPDRTDGQVQDMVDEARKHAGGMAVDAAAEGMVLEI
ncbi:MAG: MBL fold metallo-hydrolase [Proteobacteria bacterium]|nr:MBL fold metallo-hydrolase [Pseudomonadota bacterium]MBU4276513.1 MBL fold metallo-hydrolase [Pseudomonadota bacterium]MBU4381788.1 MBL fold metallo-hydrolase [Pseudomonadota bacterium]MBU4606126.1 MBL fold metallo-hydrolase [Pseudomonadota bacterium]MCG2765743.1 MBL fold metallo-hydrolase [Desulfarculaceae bacterium]